MKLKGFYGAIGVTLAVVLAAGAAAAQSWPSRPVTVVVPFPAGSGPDVLARHVAADLADKFRQPFIVENRAGANGNIAASSVAKADPNGYTLLLATPGIAVQNKFVYRTMPFDFDRDFVPIVLMSKAPMLLMTTPKLPPQTLAELIAYAKANPRKVNVSTTGVGSQGHITLELLKRLAGIDMTHLPYNSPTQALTDMIAGQIEAGFNYVSVALAPVLDGKIRALAITSTTRLGRLPAVPTLTESGFPGFEAVGWYSLIVPRGTPADVIAKINSTVNAFLLTEKGRQHIDNLVMQVAGGSPEDLSAWIKSENERWGPILKAAAVPM
jgi:tripartite-type tricarboxylate transporter receptor subunit TctC